MANIKIDKSAGAGGPLRKIPSNKGYVMASAEHDQFLTTMLQATAEVRTAVLSIDEQRAGYEAVASAYPVADDVTVEPADAGGVPAEWLSVPGIEDGRTVLYLHGGGYTTGSLSTHRDLASRIGRAAGAGVLSVQYRLAPEHPFPAALDDAVCAFRWLVANGQDPRRITLAGDSAGGGLVATLLLALRDEGDPPPGAAVMIAPWTDLVPSDATLARRLERDALIDVDKWGEAAGHYVGELDPSDPRISPLHADLSGLCPVLVQVGTADGLLEDGQGLVDGIRSAGGDAEIEVFDGCIHVFQQLIPWAPETVQAVDAIGMFVQKHAP